MSRIIIFNGKLVTPHETINKGYIIIEKGKIIGLGSGNPTDIYNTTYIDNSSEYIDAAGFIISPGLIDIHIHGAAGRDSMEGKQEALVEISRYLAIEGTTGFLAATLAAPMEDIKQVLTAVEDTMKFGGNIHGAELLGVHLEGPYLNPEKRGAHPLEYLKKPSLKELEGLFGAFPGIIKTVTLAPELLGAEEVIPYLAEKGVVVAAGHTIAALECVKKAIENGLSHGTHLFNGMEPVSGRNPGAVGALLANKEVTVDIIADGVHLHPENIKLIIEIKGTDKVILISDAVPAAGFKINAKLGQQDIIIDSGAAKLADGTLAGSILTLPEAVKNICTWTGIEIKEALKMATLNPARFLGISDRKGSLEVGKDGDIVVLDHNFRPVFTMARGNIIFNNLKRILKTT